MATAGDFTEQNPSRYTAHGDLTVCAECIRIVWSEHVDGDGLCCYCNGTCPGA